MDVVRSEKHYQEKEDGFLATYHFSSGSHVDPKNNNFGFLRVFNEYTIPPEFGSEFLFNDNIEIIGIILDGELMYKDNLGNREIIYSNEIYRISAGRGIIYSGINNSKIEVLKLLELWVYPSSKGLQPSFMKTRFSTDEKINKLLRLIAPKASQNIDPAIPINQDTNLYICKLSGGKKISYNIDKERIAYLFIIHGNISFDNNIIMNKGDAAKISSGSDSIGDVCLDIDNSFSHSANLVLIDLPKMK